MWHIILVINSALWILAALYLVYAFGNLILFLAWKEFLLGLLIFAFLSIAQVAIGAVNMW